ncbi:electron transport complex protein RnfC [candidate division LCP-89 bacterium B3_LCP]|uniref:Electron transport complex protein RnfC n=1 Tax=candidate division LCP-89 bacterium B3_LCP TaxID=2012998 RepID=A0A532UPU9_UNCL8|nr:MAG: electron transport complex protein RnfC [candidate division LCP-89 bacterium B3_LCP]
MLAFLALVAYICTTFKNFLMNSNRNIAETARQAGIVGAGGAGFPTHVKLQANVEAVIVNGAECEPLLANDKALMTNRTQDLLHGLELAVKATGAQRSIIAVKAKNKDVINHLRSRTGSQAVEIFELSDYYPAGDEQEIVRDALGRTVPEAGLPLEVGALVQNVETLVNLAKADEGEVVTKRVLTVVGEVGKPAVVEAPIGMSAGEVIEQCGGITCDDPILYIGGPMMGEVTPSLDQPITKTLSGLFILPKDNFLIQKRSISMRHILRQAQAACTTCMQCTEACPRYLLGHRIHPHKIMGAVSLGLTDQSDTFLESFLCMFCGMCEYACPMWLSPKRVYAEVRAELSKKGSKYPRRERDYRDHPMREARRIPVSRLIRRYGLTKYDRKLPVEIKPLETQKVHIPLRQHLGIPASPIVSEGEYVKAGQLLGEIPDEKLGARIHASIEGRVIQVGPEEVIIER